MKTRLANCYQFHLPVSCSPPLSRSNQMSNSFATPQPILSLFLYFISLFLFFVGDSWGFFNIVPEPLSSVGNWLKFLWASFELPKKSSATSTPTQCKKDFFGILRFLETDVDALPNRFSGWKRTFQIDWIKCQNCMQQQRYKQWKKVPASSFSFASSSSSCSTSSIPRYASPIGWKCHWVLFDANNPIFSLKSTKKAAATLVPRINHASTLRPMELSFVYFILFYFCC